MAGLYPYRTLVRARAVVVRPYEPFDLEQSLATLEALQRDVRVPELYGLLWDARRRRSLPTVVQIHQMSGAFRRWGRVALLAGPDAQFGLARMASILTGSSMLATKCTKEALRWVRQADAASPSLAWEAGPPGGLAI